VYVPTPEPWRTSRWSRWIFCEGTADCGVPRLEKVYREGLQPTGRIHTGAGEECEVEGAAERRCYGLTTVPQSISPCASWEWQ